MMIKVLSIITGVLVLGIIGVIGFGIFQKDQPAHIGCSMEAKICPDGSAVGRTGPKCQFAPCPDEGNSTVGYIAGHVTLGPMCPDVREGQPCPIPIEAYISRSVAVYAADGTTVKEKVNLDRYGNYSLALAPGTYFVQIQPAGIGAGVKKQATVKASETITIDFDIDTGIR